MRLWSGAASGACMALIFSLQACALGTASDNAFKSPTVDYSAVMITEVVGAIITTKVFYGPVKTRTEMNFLGHPMINITDRATKDAISLDPVKKTYFKIDLSRLRASPDPMITIVKKRLQGKETINGVQTSRYVYEGSSGGAEFTSTVWMTKDNIAVRTESRMARDGRTSSYCSHLENLKIEKQDPSLFEVPADYTLQQMPEGKDKP